MTIRQTITVIQEKTETKKQFMEYVENLENQGFQTIGGFTVNPQEQLACVDMVKYSRIGFKNVPSSEFLNIANDIVNQFGEGEDCPEN
jgi:hypothetical protein